jgi:hypothetical protein
LPSHARPISNRFRHAGVREAEDCQFATELLQAGWTSD